jgi:hypothetical protein
MGLPYRAQHQNTNVRATVWYNRHHSLSEQGVTSNMPGVSMTHKQPACEHWQLACWYNSGDTYTETSPKANHLLHLPCNPQNWHDFAFSTAAQPSKHRNQLASNFAEYNEAAAGKHEKVYIGTLDPK